MRICLRGIIALGLCLTGLPSALAQLPAKPAGLPAPPPVKIEPVGPLNLTPLVVDMESDGFSAKYIVFKDGARRKHIGLPAGWVAAGNSGEMFLTNPNIPDARITLRLSSLQAPVKYDPNWIESTKSLILAGVPTGAKDPAIANVTPGVLDGARWATIDFKTAYTRNSRKFATGWLFIRLPDKRFLEVIYSSPDEKFPQVRTDALQMMSGWDLHVEPGQKEIR